MTPREKAIDLYTYYVELVKDYTRGVSVRELAKECALKCVSEILEDRVEVDGMKHTQDPYWIQVYKQVEKL